MSDKNVYKVGLVVVPPDSYIDINNNYVSVVNKMWVYISNILKKKRL